MVDCREATALAQAALDRPLTPWERLKLGIHRLICGPCRIYQRQIEMLRRVSAELGRRGTDDAALDDGARQRIRARLRGGHED